MAIWLHTAISSDARLADETLRPVVASVLASSSAVLDDIGMPIPVALRDALSTATLSGVRPDCNRIGAWLDVETLRHFSVAGSPAEVGDAIRGLVGSGVDHVAVVPWLVPGQTLQEFAQHLAGALTDGALMA